MVLNMLLERMTMQRLGFLKWNQNNVLALYSENQFWSEEQI